MFTQDILQDDLLKLDESFTNSFINELMMVRMSVIVCDIGYQLIVLILPRDAMLTRYMLSSCVCTSICPAVCLSVCHVPVLYQNG